MKIRIKEKKFCKENSKMCFKTILALLLCLIFQLKYAENQSCLDWSNWISFKSKFKFKFDNISSELTA